MTSASNNKKEESKLRQTLRWFISSGISLAILALITMLMTRMGQGLTIVVSLFESPLNLVFTIILINFLALILSHFPYYFEAAIKDSDYNIDWVAEKVLGFNFVFHHNDGKRPPVSSSYTKFLRRHIGVMVYFMWYYILIVAFKNTFELNRNTVMILNGLVLLFSFLFHLMIQKIVVKIKSNPNQNDKAIAKLLKLYLGQVKVNLGLLIILLILVYYFKWHRISIIFTIIYSFFNIALYIYFRYTRSFFHNINNTSGLKSIFPFQTLGNTKNYLIWMGLFGNLVTIPVFVLGYLPGAHLRCINPIPLLIIIIIFYYSGLVILLKHLFYHNLSSRDLHKNVLERKTHRKWSILLFGLILFPIVSFFFMSKVDNDLHTLQLKKNQSTIGLNTFKSNIDTTYKNKFYIGSYGGGLKANVWNLLLLDELDKRNPNVLKNTVCMSGVSGGAIGLANYTALKSLNTVDQDSKIDQIAHANMLSTDLFGLLVKDHWFEIIPLDIFNGKDRAWQSMKTYEKLIGVVGPTDKTTMQSFWLNVYNKNDNSFPALIFNTTPTTSDYGVACSLKETEFPISIDILKFQNEMSLTFFGAASTTNRFPLFSPTARIPGKGHFVDGGYFENSGMLNAQEFVKKMDMDTMFNFIPINIINDKNIFILLKLQEAGIDAKTLIKKEKHAGELMSIINGIVALERMPKFVREMITADGTSIIPIAMPFPFNLKDIKVLTGADEINDQYLKKLNSIISENNLKIKNALSLYYGDLNFENEIGIVVPPLGRLMSTPAIDYQKAMILYNKDVKENLDQVQQYLEN